MVDYGIALLVRQHHFLVAVFIGDLLCADAGRFRFFQNANRRSFRHLWIYVAHCLFPGRVVSGSVFITQTHIYRFGDHVSQWLRLFDLAVLRDLFTFVRRMGIRSGRRVLVSDDQSNTHLGIQQGARTGVWNPRRGEKFCRHGDSDNLSVHIRLARGR